MGLYLELPEKQGKAHQLTQLLGAYPTGSRFHRDTLGLPAHPTSLDEDRVVVCVVEGPAWDAAMVVADQIEFDRIEAARRNGDRRPRHWLYVPRDLALANLREHGASDAALAEYGLIPKEG